MRRLFGTDGVRGLANGELLTPELSLLLAASAARVLAEFDRSHRPVAVVGRDPRASGEMLEAAVVAGLASAGADAVRVGVLPTPAVAHLVSALGADLGVMISAILFKLTTTGQGLVFFAQNKGIEYELLLLAAAVALVLTGPGKLSLDFNRGWARRPHIGSVAWLVLAVAGAVAVWVVLNGANPLVKR